MFHSLRCRIYEPNTNAEASHPERRWNPHWLASGDQGRRYLALPRVQNIYSAQTAWRMSMLALNISAHSRERREGLEANAGTPSRTGRGRESEIREWNVRNNPGGGPEVKVKVVADSADAYASRALCSPAVRTRESRSETGEPRSIRQSSNTTERV